MLDLKIIICNYIGRLIKTSEQWYNLCYSKSNPYPPLVAQERQYLRREHFNQWYRLSSYIMALLMSQFVMSFIMSLISSAIIYVLSGQPMELFRYVLFFAINFLTTLMGSTYGILVGSIFSQIVSEYF